MKNKTKLILTFMAVVAFPAALLADAAIYFCEKTGSYGAAWGGPIDGVSAEALRQCQSSGGTACEELVACEGKGYGAIAVSTNAVLGASCGYESQREANKAALISCIQSDGDGCTVKHTWNG